MLNASAIEQMANGAAKFRDECAALAEDGKRVLISVPSGAGMTLICAGAARLQNARRTLLIVPSSTVNAAMEMLDSAGYPAVIIERKRDAAMGACRQAVGYMSEKPVIFLACPTHIAELGHWHEAWRDAKPFDFIGIVNAEIHSNTESERGRGLETILNRVKTALLVCCSENTTQNKLIKIKTTWNAEYKDLSAPERS